MYRMFNAARIFFPRRIAGHTLSSIPPDPNNLGPYIPRRHCGHLSVQRAKLLHTTSHPFTNGLRTHLEYAANFLIAETIAKVKLQNCRIFRVHQAERLLDENARLRL